MSSVHTLTEVLSYKCMENEMTFQANMLNDSPLMETQEKEFEKLQEEHQNLKRQLADAHDRNERVCANYNRLRMDYNELEDKNKWFNKLNGFSQVVIIFLGLAVFFISFKAVFSPVTHRLSPTLGLEGEGRSGQVVGFHYEVKSWWGLRTTRYNQIKFPHDGTPLYFADGKWKTVPWIAWGDNSEYGDSYEDEDHDYR